MLSLLCSNQMSSLASRVGNCCSTQCVYHLTFAQITQQYDHYQAFQTRQAKSQYLLRIKASQIMRSNRPFYRLGYHTVCRVAIFRVLGVNPKKWYCLDPLPEPKQQLIRLQRRSTVASQTCKFWFGQYLNRSGDVMPNARLLSSAAEHVPAQINLPVLESKTAVYTLYCDFLKETGKQDHTVSMSMKFIEMTTVITMDSLTRISQQHFSVYLPTSTQMLAF